MCHRYWEVAEKSGDKSPRRARFIIAGFSSEWDQLEACTISSFVWDSIPSWRLTKIENLLVTPSDANFQLKLGEIYAEDLRKYPATLAVHVMETQRGHLFEHIEDGQPAQGGDLAAGKFCQLTTLTRAGISTKILKRWQ
ncbi:hypothetical protein MKK50_22935 [Methylobacterium sp. J-043]|nr:hypothetical protein [Methylobacterium sp. J-043]